MDSNDKVLQITSRGIFGLFITHLWWLAFLGNLLISGPHDEMKVIDSFLMLGGVLGGPIWPVVFYTFLWKSSSTGKKITTLIFALVMVLYALYAFSVWTTV